MEAKPPLRSILDCFEEGACLLDEAGTVRCMNAAAETLTGYREEELVGHSLRPIVKTVQSHELGDPGSGAHAAFKRAPASSWSSIQFLRKDGSVSDAFCTQYPLGQDGAGLTLLKFRKRERDPLQPLALQDIKLRSTLSSTPCPMA
jgi:phosphoserine phosphatase RsbU/P